MENLRAESVPSSDLGGGFRGGLVTHPGKKFRATETRQKTQTISNKCGKRGDEGKEKHHTYESDDGPPDSNMKKLNESRPPEVGSRMRHNLFPAKSVTSLGTWNVVRF